MYLQALLFLIVFSLILLLTYIHVHHRLMDSIKSQQEGVLSIFASQIEKRFQHLSAYIDQLSIGIHTLANSNKLTVDDVIDNPEILQSYLDDRILAHFDFTNGLFIFSPEGRLVSENPFISKERIGMDFSHRDYIMRTISTLKPFISSAYVSSKSKHPSIMFTAPLIVDGELKLILGVAVDLLEENILSNTITLPDNQHENHGTYFSIIDDSGNIVLHPDRSLIMKTFSEFYRPILKKFDEEDYVTATMDNIAGLRLLASFQKMHCNDWVIVMVTPEQIVLSPINVLRTVTLIVVLLFSAFFILSVFLLNRLIFEPLKILTAYIDKHKGSDINSLKKIPFTWKYEIGTLVNFSDSLIGNIKKQGKRLCSLSIALEENAAGIVITDNKTVIQYVNKEFCRLSGYSKNEVIGQNINILESGKTPKDTFDKCWSALEKGEIFKGEFINKKKNGELYYELNYISPLTDTQDEKYNYVASKIDITTIKLLEKKLKKRADYDDLTKLIRRNPLYKKIEDAINYSIRFKTLFALFFVDLDGFKDINDNYGHDCGDLVIKTIANRLLKCVRKVDTVSRIGGDEFVVLLNYLKTKGDIEPIANKTIDTLKQPITLRYKDPDSDDLLSEDIVITSSIGISLYPEDGKNAEELIQKADQAMYKIKKTTKNGYTKID